MPTKDSWAGLQTFGQFEQFAGYLLWEAFRYAHRAATDQIANELFGERIEAIELESGWIPPALPEPQSLTEGLRLIDQVTAEVLPDSTAAALRQAWDSANTDAATSGRRLTRAQRLSSTEILAHVIMLATCVEAVVNRRLFQLREIGELDPAHYNSLDRIELLPKILFLFKDEIRSKKLPISAVRHLATLRNGAVHFKGTSIEESAPSVEQLLGMWREVGVLFSLIEGEPTQAQMQEYTEEFTAQWLVRSKATNRLMTQQHPQEPEADEGRLPLTGEAPAGP